MELRELEEIKVIKVLRRLEPSWSCSKITKATHKIVSSCRKTGQSVDDFLDALIQTKWEMDED